MEIKIDTKKDSSKDIEKTIEFLQRIIEASSNDSNENESLPSPDSGTFNMFGDNSSSDSSSSYEDKKDEDDDTPPMTIVEY